MPPADGVAPARTRALVRRYSVAVILILVGHQSPPLRQLPIEGIATQIATEFSRTGWQSPASTGTANRKV
jgi:hypothetical protein